MLTLKRSIVLAGTCLAIYSILLVIPWTGVRTSPLVEGMPIGMLLGSCSLFLVIFLLLIVIIRTPYRLIETVNKKLKNTDSVLSDTKVTYEKDLKKRLFEISIVNASLNREIAERLQTENESRELRNQMELILNSAGEGIFGLDTKGGVTFVNTAATVMLGWNREEILGKSHHELVHHSKADGTKLDQDECSICQAYRDGIVHSSSTDVFWTNEGNFFPVEYVSTPIVDGDEIKGAVVVFRDLSMFS